VNRRPLVVALLIYVGLDLSLPAMPGAFMFDPDESVDSVPVTRDRAAAEVVVLPTPASDPVSSPPSLAVTIPFTVATRGTRVLKPVVNWFPRSSSDPPPDSSEDPY
jgi:hypothetical protein